MTRGDKGELFIRFVPLFTLSLFSKIVCSLWSCDKIKREIARRGNKKSLEIMYDGFYLTRGYHASSTIHDVKSGKIVAFAHRSKKGLGSNWGWDIRRSGGGYLRGAVDWPQGRALQREGVYNRPRRNMCNVLLEQFPEAEVIYCGNNTIKTFHSDLANKKRSLAR